MTIKQLKKINWQYVVRRKGSVLFNSITDDSNRYFRKLTGINWRARHILRLDDGGLYYSLEELDELISLISKKGINLLNNFSRKLVYHIGELERMASKIEKIIFLRMPKKLLVKLLNEYVGAALNAQCFLVPLVIVDKVISKLILDLLPKAPEHEKQSWLMTLTYPVKENIQLKEKKSFYSLVKFFRNPIFNRLLENHLKKYAGMGARAYWLNRYWRKNDILERLAAFFDQKKDPTKELKHLEELIREKKIIAKKLTKRLNIKKSSLLNKYIQLGKRFAFLRTWRTDIINGAGYKAKNLFYEIANRSSIKNIDEIAYLTYRELTRMARTEKMPISLKELEQRKKYVTEISLNDEYMILSGERWRKKIQKIIIDKTKKADEIKGVPVFPGKTEGVVKTVLSNKDIRKVKKGEILVAVMAFPHFISAMEKAAAFITDEGGILCHAAIVSRELKIPCIIGTKIATQVLKDGDRVEVDANNGVVKKL